MPRIEQETSEQTSTKESLPLLMPLEWISTSALENESSNFAIEKLWELRDHPPTKEELDELKLTPLAFAGLQTFSEADAIVPQVIKYSWAGGGASPDANPIIREHIEACRERGYTGEFEILYMYHTAPPPNPRLFPGSHQNIIRAPHLAPGFQKKPQDEYTSTYNDDYPLDKWGCKINASGKTSHVHDEHNYGNSHAWGTEHYLQLCCAGSGLDAIGTVEEAERNIAEQQAWNEERGITAKITAINAVVEWSTHQPTFLIHENPLNLLRKTGYDTRHGQIPCRDVPVEQLKTLDDVNNFVFQKIDSGKQVIIIDCFDRRNRGNEHHLSIEPVDLDALASSLRLDQKDLGYYGGAEHTEAFGGVVLPGKMQKQMYFLLTHPHALKRTIPQMYAPNIVDAGILSINLPPKFRRKNASNVQVTVRNVLTALDKVVYRRPGNLVVELPRVFFPNGKGGFFEVDLSPHKGLQVFTANDHPDARIFQEIRPGIPNPFVSESDLRGFINFSRYNEHHEGPMNTPVVQTILYKRRNADQIISSGIYENPEGGSYHEDHLKLDRSYTGEVESEQIREHAEVLPGGLLRNPITGTPLFTRPLGPII